MTPPSVIMRLEMEGLRMHCMRYFADSQEALKPVVEEALKKSIESFDYKAAVEAAVNQAVADAVKSSIHSFFTYGKGSEAIRGAITEALSQVFTSPEQS